MQLDATLTLEKAKKMVRQKEAVILQGQQLRGDGTKGSPLLIEPVGSRRPTRPRQPLVQNTPDQGRRSRPPASSSTGTSSSECTRCGNSRHARGDTGVLHWRPSAIAVIGEDTIALGASLRQYSHH